VDGIRVVDEDSEHRSWVPRVLAPLAFFAAATLLVLLVNSAMNAASDGEAEATPPAAPGPTATEPNTTVTVPRAERRFYRIRSGDTLEQIAARFDTTVDDLLAINPGIDAQALTPGQRIRIR
jgi:nucleoid-associated protein YgaU